MASTTTRYSAPWNERDGYLYEKLFSLDANMATVAGGGPITLTAKPVSVVPVYDVANSRTLAQATMSDGTVLYFTGVDGSNALTGPVAATTVTLGGFPASGSISLGAGAVDLTTTRVELTTESLNIVGKTGTGEWVKDVDTDTIVWQEAIYDAVSDSFAYTYTVSPGGAVFTPTGAVEAAVVETGDIQTVAKVDDVAGDQSGALVNYVEVRTVDPVTGLTTLLETLTEDLSAAYVVLGTPRNGSEIGVNARTAPFSELLPVGDWTPSPLVESFAYAVFTVGDTLDPPTFTGTDNVTTDLYQGETANFQLSDNTEALNTTNLKITVKAGDVVKVYGVKYSA